MGPECHQKKMSKKCQRLCLICILNMAASRPRNFTISQELFNLESQIIHQTKVFRYEKCVCDISFLIRGQGHPLGQGQKSI